MTARALGRAATVGVSLLVFGSTSRGTFAADSPTTASRVVLVRERGADVVIDRAEVRLAAELRAAGFQVEERSVEATEEARQVVEETGEAGPFASVLLRRSGGHATTDVWVADHVTHKTVVRQIASRGGEGSDRALALSVVELMRASLVESLVLSPPPTTAPPDTESPVPSLSNEPPSPPQGSTTPPPPPDVDHWTRQAVREPYASRPRRIGLRLGLAGMYTGSDVGLSLAPEVRVLWHPTPPFGVGLFAVTSAGGGAISKRREGSAVLTEQMVLAEASWEAPFGGPLRPLVSLGAGAYHLSAKGDATSGFVDAPVDVWTAIGSVGVGVRWQLTTASSIVIDIEGLLALPRPVIVFGGHQVATAMHPGTLAGASLAVDL